MPLSRAILDAPAYVPAIPNVKDGKTADIEAIDEKFAIQRAWEAVKKVIAERDGYACRMCGRGCRYGDPIETKADPHHIILESLGGASESWNLLYLCRRCHHLCHKAQRFWLSGNADLRDELGKGCVKVERQIEGGFEVVGFV